MVFSMNKKNISELFEDEEMIELTILEMHNSEFLIHIETQEKKISIITDVWEDLIDAL